MIVGVAVVKNEDDIIEAMVRHNLRFLDHLTVIDNGSTDRTIEILAALEAEGLACNSMRQPGVDHRQNEILTAILPELSAQHKAHQFILLDSDEFIKADPQDFKNELSGTTEVLSFQWVTYVPSEMDRHDELNPLRRISYRRVKEVPAFRKVSVPAYLAGKASVSQGSHTLSLNGELLPLVPSKSAALAHFPIRSKDQLLAKVLTGAWAVRYRNRNGGDGREARHWKRLASHIRWNGDMDDEMFYQASRTYAARHAIDLVNDPIETDIELRYTQPPHPNQALLNIIRYTEDLIADIENTHRSERTEGA